MHDEASLDRLHDLVTPPAVSWWPLAPGWYVVLAVAAALITAVCVRQWLRWRANAYRRAALAELEAAKTAADISELLRRTALAEQPRDAVAALTGGAWSEWLAQRGRSVMPPEVREQLSHGAYRKAPQHEETSELRTYAADWIRHHQRLPSHNTSPGA